MDNLVPGLYVVATPLGNLGDFTQRAHDVLSHVDVIVCEDTREMKKLMSLVGIERGSRDIISIHEHNEHEKSNDIVDLVLEGKSAAYASDAGMPAISDPGAILVDRAHTAGVLVTSVPGATAVTTAIAVSGFVSTQFIFVGFFPRDSKEKIQLVDLMQNSRGSIVFYESPKRLQATLKYLSEHLTNTQRAVVCRELTKKFEEIRRGTFSELADHFSGETKGECVVVVEADLREERERDAGGKEVSLNVLAKYLAAAGLSSKDSVELLHSATGYAKNDLKEIFHNAKSAQ